MLGIIEIFSIRKIITIIAVIFSFSLPAKSEECGVVDTDLFRNSEKYTQIDEFPWMARVAFNISYDEPFFETPFLCQAVLISEKHLLVIAKCIDRKDSNFEPNAVLLGDWNTSNDHTERDCDSNTGKCSTPILIAIDEIIIHPFYNTLKRENDIAMLRLAKPVTFSNYIRPICLPTKDIANKEFGSEELKLTGWFRHLGLKQKMSIFAYNQHDCSKKFSTFDNFNITDTHLCGIAGDTTTHFASGAALMDVKDKESVGSQRKAYLAGMVCYRFRSFFRRDQIVFLRIDRLLNWIEQNMY